MERELIAWLRGRLPSHPLLRLGPGDDAAVLEWSGRDNCVVTVDMVTDGVDFRLGDIDPRRAGRKALAVNLSDAAAMAAVPRAAVVALVLPRGAGYELAVELYEGMLPLAERYDVVIAGGDTNSWDGPLAIAVTLIGELTHRGPLVRSGARPEDVILVTGAFGGSRLGKHLDFEPRLNEARILHQRYDLDAGMDVSDGLAIDLSRMASESACGACVRFANVPIDPAAEQWATELADGSSPLDHALGDGEDFELLLAASPEVADAIINDQPLDVPVTAIGLFVKAPGLWQIGVDGERRPLAATGYEHE